MKVLIDNGHGAETPGKRSPDGRLREYAYTRETAMETVRRLRDAGIDAVRLVPEEHDVPLSERVGRANRFHADNGGRCLLVSLHCNAAGDGSQWLAARGWSVFVDPAASGASRRLAEELARAASERGVRVRREHPGRDYWERPFYICRRTHCPAVLVENLFQDNREDVDFLLSDEGRRCIVDLLTAGIRNYLMV